MASKTLILRPISLTSDDESKVTFYPSNTTIANAHMLVNEETADDDATYITSDLGSNVNYHFVFDKPSDFKNIIGISILIRYKFEASSSMHSLTYTVNLSTESFAITNTTTPTSTIYADQIENFTDDLQSAIVTELNNTQSLSFYITQALSTTQSSKSKPVRTTQMYIEVTYENNSSVLQYFKQDTKWVNIGELAMYYRSRDSWDLLTDLQIDAYIDPDKKYLIEVID